MAYGSCQPAVVVQTVPATSIAIAGGDMHYCLQHQLGSRSVSVWQGRPGIADSVGLQCNIPVALLCIEVTARTGASAELTLGIPNEEPLTFHSPAICTDAYDGYEAAILEAFGRWYPHL